MPSLSILIMFSKKYIARDQDYMLVTSQIRLFPSIPLSDIRFTFINDAIGQENNETFQLRFNTIPSTANGQIIEEPLAVHDTLNATILDGDSEF